MSESTKVQSLRLGSHFLDILAAAQTFPATLAVWAVCGLCSQGAEAGNNPENCQSNSTVPTGG